MNIPDYKTINPDVWSELVAKRDGIDLRDHNNTRDLYYRFSPLAKKRMAGFLADRAHLPNIVMETTGKTISNFFARVREAKAAGYTVTVVFVWVPLEVALARNAARARVVDPEVVKLAYVLAMKNKDDYLAAGDHGWVLDNSTPHENTGSSARDLLHFRSGSFIKRF